MRPDTPRLETRDELAEYVESYADRVDGRLGVFLGFPRGPDEFDVVAERNAETAFAAASVIKLPVLYALYDEYDGRLGDLDGSCAISARNRVAGSGLYHLLDSPEPSVEDLARAMIAISDNAATNELVDLLGMERIEEAAADLGMARTRLRRKMMATVGDNDLELSGDWPEGDPANATAPADCARLFADLIHRATLSEAAYDRLAVPLREQKHAMLFPRYLPMEVECVHKTGQLPTAALDTGYVEPPGKAGDASESVAPDTNTDPHIAPDPDDPPLAFAVFADDLDTGTDGADAIAEIGDATFSWLSSRSA